MIGNEHDIVLGQTRRERLDPLTSTFDTAVDAAVAATITTNRVVESPSLEVDGEVLTTGIAT